MNLIQTLILGARGLAVRDLQKALTTAGFTVDLDGIFDEATEQAVAAFQRAVGLVVDGIAGPKTFAALLGKRGPRHLGFADLERAAKTLGVPVAAVQAVNEVESRGEGFLDNGKVVILFERHVFYQRLVKARGQAEADRLAAIHPNLINPKPGGYAGGAAEWQRLTSARQIDEACALESCSWGLFQVMGYHWQTLGYASVQDFVACMQTSEAEQLDAFVRFIKADAALLKALKASKWADFARGYNGPAYARNLYDVKLERAFARYSAAAQPKDAA
jgi:peptidoglycan hydrolase-like protein with peptidoglycan-binding domain